LRCAAAIKGKRSDSLTRTVGAWMISLSESADSLKTLRCGAILNPPRFFYMLSKIAFLLA